METEDNADTSGVMTKSMFLPGAGFAQNLHLKWYVYLCIYWLASIALLMSLCTGFICFLPSIYLFFLIVMLVFHLKLLFL